MFQWAPTLGGECYLRDGRVGAGAKARFQWAPTLGGECYGDNDNADDAMELDCFNGHPPLGVNATRSVVGLLSVREHCVSMGTHPWG